MYVHCTTPSTFTSSLTLRSVPVPWPMVWPLCVSTTLDRVLSADKSEHKIKMYEERILENLRKKLEKILVDTAFSKFTWSLLMLFSYFLKKEKGFENNTCVFSSIGVLTTEKHLQSWLYRL